MLASVPNFFLTRSLYACMFLSGLCGEKWFSCTNPSIGSAMAGRSCCSREQSIPASLYFFVMPKEGGWVISRRGAGAADATKSTSGVGWVVAPDQGLEALVSSGGPGPPSHLPPG